MRYVLITGGAGYVGSHSCKVLARSGYTPVVLDDLCAGHRWAVKWGPLVVGDISDQNLVINIVRKYRIQAVIHFAAYAYVGESISAPRKYFDNNVGKTLALLDALLNTNVRHFVFSSSCATYGIPKWLPISEDHPQNPVSPYGASKVFVENVLEWYQRAYGLRHLSLRYFNAAGADPDSEIGEDHSPETHLIPLVIEVALGRRNAVEVFGTDYNTADGTAIRDYVHVCDLADAHVRALDYLLKGGSSTKVNLGTGCGHSVRDVIAAVHSVSGQPIKVVAGERRQGDPPALVAAPQFGQSLLGWIPARSDLQTIVRTAWTWHQAHAGLHAGYQHS